MTQLIFKQIKDSTCSLEKQYRSTSKNFFSELHPSKYDEKKVLQIEVDGYTNGSYGSKQLALGSDDK